ncbi:MAG TPA: BREX-1 system phosphatase PglZ type A [Bacillota bacterium]|nr:BREX-1 system phosphatase PglZ type A [Bacillota bacterium]
MELTEIKRVLEENFNRELADGKKRNLVFWYDDAAEFCDEIDELQLANAKIFKLNGKNNFQAKYLLEHEDQASNYLIYAPFSKPAARENYLLDIQKYSIEFTTDKATAIMRDLNVTDDALREGFYRYLKFFNNKDRYKVFKSYSLTSYTEELLDIAVLSALCKLPYPDFEEAIKALLAEYAEGKTAIYESIEKFGDPAVFWNLAGKYYGYNLESKDLGGLAVSFFITGLSFTLSRELPKTWESFISPKKSDVVVFLNHFMGNVNTAKVYQQLSALVGERIKLKEYFSQWELDSYLESDLFALFDEAIIHNILDKLLSDVGEFEKYQEIILGRRTKHWFTEYENEYYTVYWSCSLLDEWKKQQDTLKEYPPHEFFQKYVDQYYLIDTAYRKFIRAYDRARRQDWFETLREKIENTYNTGYLNTLSLKWSSSIQSLETYWGMGSLQPQWRIFNEQIKPHLEKGERVFVIVSDGLRFEAAKEFANMLNMERKGSTEILAAQGVLPSYTKLGMACLLPYQRIEIDSNYGISIDGISIESTENRSKFINKYVEKSVAIQYKDMVDFKRDELRQAFSGKDLIFIYHNSIDARGDHYPTEREVFDAVEETFEQIKSLIANLVNHLTATNIYVTSDHGFIYKRSEITASEKTSKVKFDESFENRRFILTSQDVKIDGTLTFDMKYLLGSDTPLKCITPKGINRFEQKGAGANYVHGGSSLQEIVIPVIRYKNERGKLAKDIQKVVVTLTSLTRRITNNITYLEFFQTERVADKRVPCRLKIYLADEDGNRISNENIIIADIKSEDPMERKFKEKFVLKNLKYDKSKKYYLILEDEEETVENIYDRIPFTVDLAISNYDLGL